MDSGALRRDPNAGSTLQESLSLRFCTRRRGACARSRCNCRSHPVRERVSKWRHAIADFLRARIEVKQVLFASMPEMQHFPLIPQPLAWYAGKHARRNNLAQARWAHSVPNVSHVDLDGLTRAEWMARDGYHPAPQLYAQVAARIGAAICARLPRG